VAPPTTRLLVDLVVYAHPLRTLSIFRALFLSATSSLTLLFPTFPLHAGLSLHSSLPLSWPFLFFSACFAFASLTVTVLHHLPVPVIHVVPQSTMLLGVESVCISTGPPAIQMQLFQHITVSPRLSGMLFRGLLFQCSVSMSPIAFEGQEIQRGYVQLHVHTIFIPVRARSCHSLPESYPSIHTSLSRMTRNYPSPKQENYLTYTHLKASTVHSDGAPFAAQAASTNHRRREPPPRSPCPTRCSSPRTSVACQ
jgi:hypothetical protein